MAEPFEKMKKSYEEMQVEEMRRGCAALAKLLSIYRDELLANGFNDVATLYLIGQYQNTMMNPKNRVPDKDD